jgi:hypothetical protein
MLPARKRGTLDEWLPRQTVAEGGNVMRIADP